MKRALIAALLTVTLAMVAVSALASTHVPTLGTIKFTEKLIHNADTTMQFKSCLAHCVLAYDAHYPMRLTIGTSGTNVNAIQYTASAGTSQQADNIESAVLARLTASYGGPAAYGWVGLELTKWSNQTKGVIYSMAKLNGYAYHFIGDCTTGTIDVEITR